MNKILVMSNDPILKRKNLEVITASGFQVAEVSDALDGLLMVDKNGFGVIIIDEELADIDGYRACQKIRQYSQIPIILLGTEQSDEVWAKIDELGFDIYLKKPVSPRELVAQLKSILRRSHQEEKTRPSQMAGPADVQPASAMFVPEVQVTKLEKPAEPTPIKLGMPVETQPMRVVSIQETAPLKFAKSAQSETPVNEEKAADTKVAPKSFQETTSLLDKTTEAEKTVPMQKSIEAVAPQIATPLHDIRTLQPEKTNESENMAKKAKPAEMMPTIITILDETKSVKLDEKMGSLTPSKPESFTYDAWSDARMSKLVDALAGGRFSEIHPVVDSSAKIGFSYPEVDRLIGACGEETRSILERLAAKQVLNRTPLDKLHMDPDGGLQLGPVERCPHCSSGNLIRGQLIEHFSCGNVGMEQDSIIVNQYLCPKCGKDLRLLGTDYRNIGIRYRCLDCNELFPTPVIKWRNLNTGKVWSYEELHEIQIYSYSLSPDKKDWLAFQFKPKAQLVNFLRLQGYQVQEQAKIHGSSGAVHTIDILATRDDGLAKYHIGIGILMASHDAQEVGIEELFEFDTKAYDVGINYKVAIVIPKLNREAAKFSERQKIAVLEANDPSMLISFLECQTSVLSGARARVSFLAQSTTLGPLARIVEFLRQRGYDVFEKVKVLGKSGAEHVLDILAQRDDLLIKPAIAIAILSSEQGQGVGIDRISQFDAISYDIGIRNKVVIGLTPITQEARQFAMQQRIKVFEQYEVENLIRSWGT